MFVNLPILQLFKNLSLSAVKYISALFIISCAANAAIPYQPDITPYAIEPHAWPELEGLPNDIIFDITTDNNSHLWIGGVNVILNYDGKTLTKYEPDNTEKNTGSYTYSLTMRKDGEMFAMSRTQMFYLNSGKWQKFGPAVSPAPQNFWVNKRIVASHDSFWLSSHEEILRIDQESFQYIPLNNGFIDHFIIDDRGYFWMIFRQSGDVKRFAFKNGQFIELNHWTNVLKNTQQSKFVQISDSEIWLISQALNQPPLTLNIENINQTSAPLPDWQEESYPSTNGYNNQAVIMDQHNNILLFSASHLHLKAEQEWYSVPLNSLGISRKILALKKSLTGEIWLLELGKAIRRFDPISPRQITINDLIFGCENQNSEFFINKEGAIIEHQLLTNNWLQHPDNTQLISTPLNILCTQQNDMIIYGSDNKTAAITIMHRNSNQQRPNKRFRWEKIHLTQLQQNIGQLSAVEMKNGDIYLGRNDELILNEGVIVKLQKRNQEYKVQDIPLNHYSTRTAVITEIQDNKLAFSNSHVNELTPNNLDPETNTQSLFLPDNFFYAWIEGLTSDAQHNLWVATWHYGVLAYKKGQWRQYALNEGLSGKNTAAITNAKNDDILALTNKGVDRFDGAVWQPLDIHGVKALREASNLVAGNDNKIWVNQTSREWIFRFQRPHRYNLFEYHQQEDIFKTIRYQPSNLAPSVEVKLSSQLDGHQNTALVSWRGFDQWFETPSSNLKYSYRLNQGEWSIFSSDTSHAFTNLPAQEYTLDVRSRDADGNISETPARLSFTISAPFWQQTWFYMLIILTFVLMLATLLILIAQRLKQTSKINAARMQFLTNISHELRNPLSLIISPIEEFFAKQPEHKNYGLQLALRNANRLKELIDQLLDYRRLHAGNIQLENKPGDFIQMLNILIADLNFIAKNNNQSVQLVSSLQTYLCKYDYDVIRKIIENLVTNALKYSGEHQVTRVTVEKYKEGILVAVEDDGVGIPISEQQQIFELFYTQKKHRFDNHTSFGVGLALVKDLVNLYRGNIQLKSPINDNQSGSRFSVYLPTLKKIATESVQLVKENHSHTREPNIIAAEQQSALKDTICNDDIPIVENEHLETNKTHLLIVDDNIELTDYLVHELSPEFKCHAAEDGKQALTYALNFIPDIIISDYKMPIMDGPALCQALKTNISTSHIPILLHTAMTSEEHQLKGLTFGAVDYLFKPMSIRVLKSRIHSLISDREKFASYVQQAMQDKQQLSLSSAQGLHKTNKQKHALSPTSETQNLNNQEEKFLSLVRELVLKHFKNSDFNAEQLAQLLHMSRSAFYRKFKALTNITPADYIRKQRLNTAKELLREGYSVSDIIRQTGYSDPSSFNRAYKSFFGVNPSEENF